MDETPRQIAVPGGPRLDGRLHLPKGASGGVVVLHPHPLVGGDKENHVIRAIVEAAASRGLATLRFDSRHVRGSPDLDEGTVVVDAEADLAAAVQNLRTSLLAGAPVAVVGYSFGGVVALRSATKLGAAAVGVVGLPLQSTLAKAIEAVRLAPVPCPVLILQGELDELGNPAAVAPIAKGFGPQVEVRPVPGAAHGYYGKAEFVGKILAGFVARRLAPT